MAIIVRPTKAGGNTTYVAEKAANANKTILASEVDADLATIYTDHNGNLTNANIAPSAAIATSKIAQDAGLLAGHLASNSVTTAKIADDAVTAAELADDASVDANRAVTTNHIRDAAITVAKMGAGASIRTNQQLTDAGGASFTSETTLFTFASITPAGGGSLVNCHVGFHASAQCTASGAGTITVRVKRNAATAFTATLPFTLSTGDTIPLSVFLPVSFALLAGAQVFTVTIQYSNVSGTFTVATSPSFAQLTEYA